VRGRLSSRIQPTGKEFLMRGPAHLIVALITVLLGACAQSPPRLQGDFASFEPNQTTTGELSGYRVRWGGVVTGERVTDVGSCVEVAVFPLDRWTLRPIGLSGTKAYQHVELIRPAYSISGTLQPAPHFLACGEQILDGSRFYPGAVLTATGIVEPPYVFETEPARCWGEPVVATDYASTFHVARAGQCAVSLPVLKISQVQAWTELPRGFPGAASYP
jgi:hypothetical protein